MKRELLCPKCNAVTEVECQRLASLDGEGFDCRAGILVRNGFACDSCLADLAKGDVAICRTCSRRGEKLRAEWVDDYLRDFTPDEAMKFGMEMNGGP